jgi:hypothetical protein
MKKRASQKDTRMGGCISMRRSGAALGGIPDYGSLIGYLRFGDMLHMQRTDRSTSTGARSLASALVYLGV